MLSITKPKDIDSNKFNAISEVQDKFCIAFELELESKENISSYHEKKDKHIEEKETFEEWIVNQQYDNLSHMIYFKDAYSYWMDNIHEISIESFLYLAIYFSSDLDFIKYILDNLESENRVKVNRLLKIAFDSQMENVNLYHEKGGFNSINSSDDIHNFIFYILKYHYELDFSTDNSFLLRQETAERIPNISSFCYEYISSEIAVDGFNPVAEQLSFNFCESELTQDHSVFSFSLKEEKEYVESLIKRRYCSSVLHRLVEYQTLKYVEEDPKSLVTHGFQYISDFFSKKLLYYEVDRVTNIISFLSEKFQGDQRSIIEEYPELARSFYDDLESEYCEDDEETWDDNASSMLEDNLPNFWNKYSQQLNIVQESSLDSDYGLEINHKKYIIGLNNAIEFLNLFYSDLSKQSVFSFSKSTGLHINLSMISNEKTNPFKGLLFLNRDYSLLGNETRDETGWCNSLDYGRETNLIERFFKEYDGTYLSSNHVDNITPNENKWNGIIRSALCNQGLKNTGYNFSTLTTETDRSRIEFRYPGHDVELATLIRQLCYYCYIVRHVFERKFEFNEYCLKFNNWNEKEKEEAQNLLKRKTLFKTVIKSKLKEHFINKGLTTKIVNSFFNSIVLNHRNCWYSFCSDKIYNSKDNKRGLFYRKNVYYGDICDIQSLIEPVEEYRNRNPDVFSLKKYNCTSVDVFINHFSDVITDNLFRRIFNCSLITSAEFYQLYKHNMYIVDKKISSFASFVKLHNKFDELFDEIHPTLYSKYKEAKK